MKHEELLRTTYILFQTIALQAELNDTILSSLVFFVNWSKYRVVQGVLYWLSMCY